MDTYGRPLRHLDKKVVELGKKISEIELVDPGFSMKTIIESAPGRFFAHKEDFVRILVEVNEKATENGIEPVVFTAGEIDGMSYHGEHIKMAVFYGYYRFIW